MDFNYLEELKKAAMRENWEFVDAGILRISKDSSYVDWAYRQGTRDLNGNIRDLAVSIIEAADIPEEKFSGMKGTLYALMKKDENPYVQFRSAFALAKHGAGKHRDKVMDKLREAEKDEDVSEIAKHYLKKLGS